MSSPRSRQLHGYLSEDAFAGWCDFAARHGTNTSALLEAVGRALGQQSAVKKKALVPWLRAVIADAQAIASVRSSRRRGTGGSDVT
jgi:hypothetical protein